MAPRRIVAVAVSRQRRDRCLARARVSRTLTASNAANAFPGTFGLTPQHTSHSFLRLIATHWDSLGCRFFVKSFTRMPTPPDDKSKFESLRSAGLLLAIPTLLIV